MSEPFISHSEITDVIYIVCGTKKYDVTEQVIRAMRETGRLEQQRPKGEWIFKNGKYRGTVCGEKAIYVCPGLSTIPKAILTDFCPKCGVQMNAKALEMIRKREGSEEE